MYCRICGKKLEQDSVFCTSCGTKIINDGNESIVDENVNSNVSSNKESKKKKKGKIWIIILIILGVIVMFNVVINAISRSIIKTYYGDGYTLEYSGYWNTVSSTYGFGDFLRNDKYDLYFTSAGNITLSNVTDSLKCDFDNVDCRGKIYSSLYSTWDNSVKTQDMELLGSSNGFNILKDDIYYAYYDYGDSLDDREGRVYIVVSKSKDALLSLSFSITDDDSKENNDIMLDLIKTITISD